MGFLSRSPARPQRPGAVFRSSLPDRGNRISKIPDDSVLQGLGFRSALAKLLLTAIRIPNAIALAASFYVLYDSQYLTVKCFPVRRIAESCEPQEDKIRVSRREKRQLVARVVNSQMFRRSSALCAFLHYITNHEILGQVDKLKEQTIGVEVLGRKPDYLPTSDNIVRVRAHELRGRLERYFASEGANEPVVITVPVGSYAPKFIPRQVAAPEMPVAASYMEAAPTAETKKRPDRYYLLPLAAIFLIALSASVALLRYVLGSNDRKAAVQQPAAMQDFWGQFFNTPNEELKVVYADPGYASWQDLSNKTLNLGDYLSRKYLNPNDDKLLKEAVRRMASPSDIEIAGHLGVLAGRFGGQVNVQFARDVSIRSFQLGNLILLGSRRSNPWVELYEPSLNFTLEVNPDSGFSLFRNRVPEPGEAAVYPMPAAFSESGTNEQQYIDYGLAALLKGCGNHGLTVLAEGLSTQGTKAVGDMLTDPERLDTLLKSMGHKAGTKVVPFEALIQMTSFPNTQYANPKVIAFRLQPRGSCVIN